jgi:predicted Holliday junction resolvase-like endonuclease
MSELVIALVIILVLLIVIVALFIRYSRLAGRIEEKARELYHAWTADEQARIAGWRENELEVRAGEKADLLFRSWKMDEESSIRQDAVKKSEAVIRGKMIEHLVPYFPGFAYNPRDARFLGTPVDLVVFDGLSGDEVRKIIFIEVKAGKGTSLSRRERSVRDCCEQGKVGYELVHIQATGDGHIPEAPEDKTASSSGEE